MGGEGMKGLFSISLTVEVGGNENKLSISPLSSSWGQHGSKASQGLGILVAANLKIIQLPLYEKTMNHSKINVNNIKCAYKKIKHLQKKKNPPKKKKKKKKKKK